MKGQVFVMVAVLVLIALIMLRNAIKPVEVSPKSFLYENFLNLKNELIKTVDISILNEDDVSTNLNNFITFSSNVFQQRGYEQNIEFNTITYENTTEVYMNFSLKLGNSFIEDKFIINRTVYP